MTDSHAGNDNKKTELPIIRRYEPDPAAQKEAIRRVLDADDRAALAAAYRIVREVAHRHDHGEPSAK